MRRRTFLTTAPAAAMAASAAASPAPGEGIRLGFDSYSLRNFKWKAIQLIDYAGSHKAETVKTVQPMLNLPPEWVEKVYDVETPMFPTDGHYDPQALKVVAQSLIDTDQIDPKTDVKSLITEQYLP